MTNVSRLPSRPHQQGSDTDLLDRVLISLSIEQRARVLELVSQLDIERDDPLFLMAVATNQLMVLVQDAPEDLAALFAAFLERLDAWGDQNLATLDSLAAEANAVRQLNECCATLAGHTDQLQTAIRTLINTLESSPIDAPGWEASLQQVQRELTLTITAMQTAPRGSDTPAASAVLKQRVERSSPKRVFLVPVLIALCGSGIGLGLWRQHQAQRHQFQQINQRLEWLLKKQNRRDCADGVLSTDDPLCRFQ